MMRTCTCGAPLERRNTSGFCRPCKNMAGAIKMPADFAARAVGKSNGELSAEIGVSTSTITKWRKEAKAFAGKRSANNRIEIPSDFIARAGSMTNSEAAAEWDVSDATITKWRKETGVKPVYTPRPPVNIKRTPPEFAEWARTMNLQQLADRAGVSKPTARRMCAELGIEPFRPAPKPKQRKTNKLIVMQNMGKRMIASAMVAPNSRDMSVAGRAADFLQKRGAIFRCDKDGNFKLGGSHWKWRGEARDAEYIINEAKERGFNPDAWRQLGAAA